MFRIPTLLVFSALAGALSAQTVSATGDPNAALVQQAFVNLETVTPLELDMQGTTTTYFDPGNPKTTSFSSTLYFRTGTDPVSKRPTFAQLELDDYDTTDPKNPILTHRYVADGRNLWSYDFTTYTYAGTFYSYYKEAQPSVTTYSGTDATEMLAQLYSRVKGPDSYLVQLLREINPYGDPANPLASTYESWAPGYTSMIPITDPPTRDPLIPTRLYMSLGTTEYVVYGVNVKNPTRSVAFKVIDLNEGKGIPNWQLSSINFANASYSHLTDLLIQVNFPTVFPTGTFQSYGASELSGWRIEPVTSS